MKIMISQPMKGKSADRIKDERSALINKLTAEGYEVIDTIILEDKDIKYDDNPMLYLSKSIELMSSVDAVVFMPGWNLARDCSIEYQIALAYNKFVRIEV